eukprot:gene22788-biopygen13316
MRGYNGVTVGAVHDNGGGCLARSRLSSITLRALYPPARWVMLQRIFIKNDASSAGSGPNACGARVYSPRTVPRQYRQPAKDGTGWRSPGPVQYTGC